ncbi:MAG: acyl-CoA dehydrogenase family protein, partial [Candidatus Obscuribacterales bacterium]|nr:acyl-CoA dehydrogenase family protein [Candidatus Obscuribacterales bacterium]
MINLALSEEQEQFQKLSREFADGEIVPESEAFDRSAAFPERILEKAWEIGLVNFQVSEDLGGMGLSTVDSCVILEELAAGCSGISAAIEASAIAQLPLILAGTDDQQEAFLQPLIDSPSVAGYASQDATTYDITAEPSGSDFILNGTHGALVNGGHSIWYFVVAEHIETNSSSAFIVPADAEGLSITGRVETPGRRARAVTKLNLDQVKLSSDHLIGSLSRADKVIESILPSM